MVRVIAQIFWETKRPQWHCGMFTLPCCHTHNRETELQRRASSFAAAGGHPSVGSWSPSRH
eukprot:scaffold45199_cov47-Prasinocladus_malaysianus.AAC.1